MVGDALSLMQLGSAPNVRGLEDELAKVYNVDRSKVFSDRATQPQAPVEPGKVAGDRAAGNNTNPQGVAKATPAGANR